MATTVMDGKALAAKVKEEAKQQALQLSACPGLAVIIVGDNPASRVYVNGKKRDCEECGFYSEEHALPGTASQRKLLELIAVLNERDDIDGILVQLPLPEQFDAPRLKRSSSRPASPRAFRFSSLALIPLVYICWWIPASWKRRMRAGSTCECSG